MHGHGSNLHQGRSTSGRLCVLVLYSSRAEKCLFCGNVVLLYFIGGGGCFVEKRSSGQWYVVFVVMTWYHNVSL